MEKRNVKDIVVESNVRKDIGDLKELTESIKAQGIIVPLIISKDNLLISGHRRLEAARLAGLTDVPVIVTTASSDENKMIIQIIENLHRKDLDPVEEGSAYLEAKTKFGMTVKMIAESIGKQERYVQRRIDIASASPEVKAAIKNKAIEVGHAVLLAQLNSAQQKELMKTIIEYDLTVQNFSDQIRWMKKIDFGELKFRPGAVEQKTLLDQVGVETDPKLEIYFNAGMRRNKLFAKELSEYVESQRAMLRDKGITVFGSMDQAKKSHPESVIVHSYDKGYNAIVKGLQKSNRHGVVVDLDYSGDIHKVVVDLHPAPVKEAKPKKLSKAQEEAEQEESEKVLAQSRQERLKSRVEAYKVGVLRTGIKAMIKPGTKQAKVVALWASIEDMQKRWDFLNSIGIKTEMYMHTKDLIGKLSAFKESDLDHYLNEASLQRLEQLHGSDLESAATYAGFDLGKHWKIDKAYLDMHTKDQLVSLANELKLEVEGTKKEEVVTELEKKAKKGMVPKNIKKKLA